MTPFRILIATSPCFADIDRLKTVCDHLLRARPEVEICRVTMKGCIVAQYRKDARHKVFVRDFNSWGKEATVYAYRDAVMYADAAVIFWNEESWNEKKLIELCMNKPMRYEVRTYKSVRREIEEAEKNEPKKRKLSPTIKIIAEAKERYTDAHQQWQARTTPEAVKDHGYTKCKLPIIRNANGLTLFICNFLNWKGHRATRINVIGRLVEGKRFTSHTRKGSADVSSTLNGKSVMWEVKFGADTPSPEQLKEQKKERAAGGEYLFVYSVEQFFNEYDKIVNGEL